ncbi:MAG: FtsH protease activity modulator HflK [Thiothrix sp.]
MPWNEPGGNQQDPWTGKNRSPGGNDPEELIRKLNQKLARLFGRSGGGDGSGNSGKGILLLAGLLIIGWLLSGFYTIDARQKGLVLRFGAYQETTNAGLHWRLPYPIETVEVIDVEQNRSAQDRSTMLTKDENIVDIAVSVQYKVSDAEAYAFNILNPDLVADQTQGTLYQVLRGSIRDIIGRNNMDFILQEGREQIAIDAQNLMQQVLDDYKAGLKILKVNLTYAEAPTEVKDAFDEANRAREDKNRFQNEAETYSKKVIPEAGGQAARLKADAEAYRQESVNRAMGDAARFSQLVTEYQKSPAVTRERLYLDAMESVMAGSRKVMVDTGSNNMLYLPLDQLGGQASGNAASAAAAARTMQQDSINSQPEASAGSNSGAVRQQPRETSVREGR